MAAALAAAITAWPACGPPDQMAAEIRDSLRFDLIAPADVRRGEPVSITLRLTNVSREPVEAHFLGREIAFDIVVTDDDGTVVWQRLAGATVPGILQVRMLGPGDVVEWHDVWRPQAPGRYQLQGMLPSDHPQPRRTAQVGLLVR